MQVHLIESISFFLYWLKIYARHSNQYGVQQQSIGTKERISSKPALGKFGFLCLCSLFSNLWDEFLARPSERAHD